MGITFEEADFFISDFKKTGAIDRNESYEEFIDYLVYIVKILQVEMQILVKNNEIFLENMRKEYGDFSPQKDYIMKCLSELKITKRLIYFSKEERGILEKIVKEMIIGY